MRKYLQWKRQPGTPLRAHLAQAVPSQPTLGWGGTKDSTSCHPTPVPWPAWIPAGTEYPGCAFQEQCLNKEKAPELLSLFPIHDSKRLVGNWFRNNPLVPPTHITERFLQQMHRKSPTSANGAAIPRTSSFGYSCITWKPRCFYFPYCTGCNFFLR